MLSEDNELMTRVENGAPMGELLRENFWFPALLSHSLIGDGKPLPVRLIGENFVAFRSTDGRVGFFDEHCPHRRASLLLARNEDNALRCIFHGWKFGVDGKVLEVPTEANDESDFCSKVPLRHYPTREAAGIVWVWLGKGAPKQFPDFEFNALPEDQVYVVHQNLRCNWVQDAEVSLDPAHVGVLHSSWLKMYAIPEFGQDRAPVFEFDEPQPAGFRFAGLRNLTDGRRHARESEFVLPWWCFISPAEVGEGDRLVNFMTPIDDYNTRHWVLKYNRVRPLAPSWANPAEERDNFPPAPPGGHDESWGQDRGAMMRGHFTGFTQNLNTEDFAVIESQGPILDRSREFLNAGDRVVLRLRKQLLSTLKEFTAGKTLSFSSQAIPYSTVRADTYILDPEQSWRRLSEARRGRRQSSDNLSPARS